MNDNYIALSGEGIYAGMVAPSAQTQLEQFIAAMPANSWAQYAGTNINAMLPRDFDGTLCGILETSGNLPLNNWANKFAWDSQRKIISGVGTAQGFLIADGYKYAKQVLFNLASNAFSVKWDPTGQTQGHVYDSNCGGFVDGKTWRKAFGPNAAQYVLGEYNTDTNSWTQNLTLSGLGSISTLWSIECSQQHGAVYALEAVSGRLVKWVVSTGARSVVGTFTGIGNYPMIVNCGSYVIFGAGSNGGAKLYKIDAAGIVTEITGSLPIEYSAQGFQKILAHPSDQNKALLFSNADSKIRQLDILTGDISDYGTIISAVASSGSVVGISMIGTGAVAMLSGKGRNAQNVTQSEFWVYRV